MNDTGIRKDRESFFCKNIKITGIFLYLIDSFYTQKSLVIGIKRILVIGKKEMSDCYS